MIRAIVTIVLTCLVPTIAIAQACSSYPYNLTNGTTADASQVMGNFEHARNCVNSGQTMASLFRGWLSGSTMLNNETSPNTVIDTAAGVATSDDATPVMMALPAFTKNANAAWSVGSGNGCLHSGSALTASTWYHLFVIQRTDTNVVDQLCSTDANPATLPTSYTKKRRIGSFRTGTAGNIQPFIQDGDYFRWKEARLDLNVNNPGNLAVERVLTVPTGVSVFAIFNASMDAVANHGVYFSDLAVPDEQPGTHQHT